MRREIVIGGSGCRPCAVRKAVGTHRLAAIDNLDSAGHTPVAAPALRWARAQWVVECSACGEYVAAYLRFEDDRYDLVTFGPVGVSCRLSRRGVIA